MFNKKKIEELRKAKNLSNKELCRLCGIGESTYYHIMKKEANPTANILEKLADVLEVAIDELFTRENINLHLGHHVQGDGNKIGDYEITELSEKVRFLEEIIKEKERTIQILMKSKNL